MGSSSDKAQPEKESHREVWSSDKAQPETRSLTGKYEAPTKLSRRKSLIGKYEAPTKLSRRRSLTGNSGAPTQLSRRERYISAKTWHGGKGQPIKRKEYSGQFSMRTQWSTKGKRIANARRICGMSQIPTLIKNKIKFSSYIRKFIMEQLPSHIWGLASKYMRRCANI